MPICFIQIPLYIALHMLAVYIPILIQTQGWQNGEI